MGPDGLAKEKKDVGDAGKLPGHDDAGAPYFEKYGMDSDSDFESYDTDEFDAMADKAAKEHDDSFYDYVPAPVEQMADPVGIQGGDKGTGAADDDGGDPGTLLDTVAVDAAVPVDSEFHKLRERLASNHKDILWHTSKNSEAYNKVSDELDGINALRANIIDKSNYISQVQVILAQYERAVKACEDYKSSHKHPRSLSGKSRLAIINQISTLLEKESIAVKDAGQYIADGPKSLEQIIAQTRTLSIYKTKDEITRTGNAGRERLSFKEGDTDYFFTQDVSLLTQQDAGRKVAEENPSEFNDIFIKYCADLQKSGNGSSPFQLDDYGYNKVMHRYAFTHRIDPDSIEDRKHRIDGALMDDHEIISNLLTCYKELHGRGKLADKISFENEEFAEAFDKFFLATARKFKSGLDSMGASKIVYGTNISKKNVAMTRMADLLGIGSIIARSTQADLSVDGKKAVSGNLMEKAIGVSYDEITGEGSDKKAKTEEGGDPFAAFREDATLFSDSPEPDESAPQPVPDDDKKPELDLSSPKLQRQSVQLQLLDGICAQRDRHVNNIFYDFNVQGGFEGIQGIDNDASFSKDDPKLGDMFVPLSKFDPIKITDEGKPNEDFSLPVVDEEVAKHILVLTPEIINYVFSDILSQEEIDATCSRVKEVQEYLMKLKRTATPEFDPFIKPDKWGEETRMKLLYCGRDLGDATACAPGRNKQTGEEQWYRRTYYGRIATMLDETKVDIGGYYGL